MSKFQVGEVVEVRSMLGRYSGWREGEVVAYLGRGLYEIEGVLPAEDADGCWQASEHQMRRKRPPASNSEQSAGSWEDVMREFTSEVIA